MKSPQGMAGSVVATDVEVITDRLSDEDMQAYKANKFVFGHIPEHPPPDVLC